MTERPTPSYWTSWRVLRFPTGTQPRRHRLVCWMNRFVGNSVPARRRPDSQVVVGASVVVVGASAVVGAVVVVGLAEFWPS
jgi:hypothetical protein